MHSLTLYMRVRANKSCSSAYYTFVLFSLCKHTQNLFTRGLMRLFKCKLNNKFILCVFDLHTCPSNSILSVFVLNLYFSSTKFSLFRHEWKIKGFNWVIKKLQSIFALTCFESVGEGSWTNNFLFIGFVYCKMYIRFFILVICGFSTVSLKSFALIKMQIIDLIKCHKINEIESVQKIAI